MNGFIEMETAETNVLACAGFVAERIGSADGYAAAVSDIALRYAAKGELDLAAQLADSIQDPHTRDVVLTEIAARCAEFDDDEYGLQIGAEAIEEYGFEQQAISLIAVKQAERGRFDDALVTAARMDDAATTLAEIAIRLARNGDEERAREIFARIDFPTVRVQVLNEFAAVKIQNGEPANAILSESLAETEAIEFDEEKTQTLLEIASRFIDAKQMEAATEVLTSNEQIAESLDARFRDQVLMQTGLLYARIGDFDRAAKVLEPVTDLQDAATAHVGIAVEHAAHGSTENAVASLEEAYAVLRSQSDRQIRDSKARYNLLAMIAIRFAQNGKPERAMEIALANPDDEPRFAALNQIAAICAANGEETMSRQAVNSIEDLAARQNALIAVSDAERRGDAEKSLQTLNEAYVLTEEVAQFPMRSAALDDIAVRFVELGQREHAAEVLRESLQTAARIVDDSQQSTALANLAQTYEKLHLEIEQPEREILRTIVRKKM